MSQPHPEWNTNPSSVHDTTVVDTTPREKSASMALLWLIALIAIAAAGLAWYKQSAIDTTPLASTPAPVVIPAEETAAAKQEAARSEQRRNETAGRTTASVTPRATAPRPLASNPTPRYPVEALRAGVGGTVMVRAEVDSNGVPTDVAVVERSGHRELDRAAQAAVRKWRFEPAMRNGKAVSSTVQVPVDFKPI